MFKVGFFIKKKRQMQLPSLCGACATTSNMSRYLPDRSDCDPPYSYEILCPLCMDELLGVYSVLFLLLRDRELTGRSRSSRFSKGKWRLG